MSVWDKADLLARVKLALNRPTTDAALTDPQIYTFLSEGQHFWMRELAAHVPQSNYMAPETMTTSDGGYTYSVLYEPLAIEVKKTRTASYPLVPGEEWDANADYVQEGKTIRRSNNLVFSEAPVARYVRSPTEIDASTDPIMKPDFARILIVKYAVVQAAKRLRMDWQAYESDMWRDWFGDPRFGTVGILGELRKRYLQEGIPTPGRRPFWRPV